MNKKHMRFVALVLMTALTSPVCNAAQSKDDVAIRNLETRQQEAWNRHDAKAYADLFAEDGDVVNVVGWWWRGREEIRKKLADAYVFVFRESVLTLNEVDVKVLTPKIAVAHVRWSMVGARTPAGFPQPQQGIQIQVLQKHRNEWLITSFQNTNAIPEVPFPKGPPGN